MTAAGRTLLLLLLLLLLAPLLVAACATWRPLGPGDWERADAHEDIFRTRLRVTRLDGRRLYVERPEWSATELRGVYPAGWPAVPAADSVIVVPRDSIARVDRLESDRPRTAIYLGGVAALAAAAVLLLAR